MTAWNDFFPILRCPNCGSDSLVRTSPSECFAQCRHVNGVLRCLTCERQYPLFENIPVMFKDDDRIRLLVDPDEYQVRLKQTQNKMQQASRVSGDHLQRFRVKEDEMLDALAWEILFWEIWKETDHGFIHCDRKKIEKILFEDDAGGGRIGFFNKVLSSCGGDYSNKFLLNIGAGRDFLLERFIEAGFRVIEQDIVLESLLLLKERGASFCVCSDARVLPFKDNVFHIATSFEVLHHIWPIEQPILELMRVTSGYVHLDEPNVFALTRAALLLPNPIKYRLKRFYSGDYSHSPYETCINPYAFYEIVRRHHFQLMDLSFTRSSWIPKNSRGMKKLLRRINLVLAKIFPLLSSHFRGVIKKQGNDLGNPIRPDGRG